MEPVIPKCPKCKTSNETIVSGVAKGKMSRVFDEDGQSSTDNYDELYFQLSHTVRCIFCGKIRKDLVYNNYEVKIK
jgi:phage FluMu protein Com